MKNVLLSLHPDEQSAIRALRKIYERVDRETKKFARKTGIRCPAQCGICCATAKVEVTPFEMLPLAVGLWTKDKGFFWLEKLERRSKARVCVFLSQILKIKPRAVAGLTRFVR